MTDNRVAHTGPTADKMHDLLNLFSGLYDWHDYKDGRGNVLHIRHKERADAIVAEAAALLNVPKEHALNILVTKADHKTYHTADGGMGFSYDASLLA